MYHDLGELGIYGRGMVSTSARTTAGFATGNFTGFNTYWISYGSGGVVGKLISSADIFEDLCGQNYSIQRATE